MKGVNHKHYTYHITWSAEDGEFIGMCAEFPSLSHLDESQQAALDGIITLVGEVLVDIESSGELIPESLSKKNYSDK